MVAHRAAQWGNPARFLSAVPATNSAERVPWLLAGYVSRPAVSSFDDDLVALGWGQPACLTLAGATSRAHPSNPLGHSEHGNGKQPAQAGRAAQIE